MRRRQFITGLAIATLSPVVVRAQQQAMPVIGYLSGWSAGDAPDYLAYFKQGLVEAGYSEDRNVEIEYRYAEGHFERLPELRYRIPLRQRLLPRQRPKPSQSFFRSGPILLGSALLQV
jgi:putative tryptophan/tyrosine transport system substrate-binding protein